MFNRHATVQEAGRYLVRRKDDIDESLIGKAMVDTRETTDIFFHACEQHIRTIDVEVADNFAVMLKRHRKELKAATAANDYAFKEQLATSVRRFPLHPFLHCQRMAQAINRSAQSKFITLRVPSLPWGCWHCHYSDVSLFVLWQLQWTWQC